MPVKSELSAASAEIHRSPLAGTPVFAALAGLRGVGLHGFPNSVRQREAVLAIAKHCGESSMRDGFADASKCISQRYTIKSGEPAARPGKVVPLCGS